MRTSTIHALLVCMGSVLAGRADGQAQTSYLPACMAEELQHGHWPHHPDELTTPRSVERMVMTCTEPGRGDPYVYVLEPQFDPEVIENRRSGNRPTRAVVARMIQGRASLEQRAILELGTKGSTVRVDHPGSRKVDRVTHDVIFYTERNTAACPAAGELHTMTVVTPSTYVMQISDPVAAGICLPLDNGSPGDALGSRRPPREALRILDYYLQADRALTLLAHVGGSANEALAVLEHRTATGPRLLGLLTGRAVLPRGCGQYLVAGRLLPGTTKVALAFAHARLRMVDYQQPSRAPIVLYDALGASSRNVFTCEGGIARHQTLRREFAVDSKVAADGTRSYFLRWTNTAGPMVFDFRDLLSM